MGVSIVSQKAAEQPARAGLISMMDFSGVDFSREFYLVYASERPLSMAADSFLKTASSDE